MKQILLSVWLIIWLSIIFILFSFAQAAEPEKDSFEFIGTTVYVETEGGFYGIETAEGKKYNPTNLPEDFQKPALQIRVNAEKVNRMGIHMWGEYIEILTIKEVNCELNPTECEIE